MVRLDLPLPLTPVTQVKVARGKAAVTCLRLLAVAPWTVTCLPLPLRRGGGGGVLRRAGGELAGGLPVGGRGGGGGSPEAISPPRAPVPGPQSVTVAPVAGGSPS